MTRDSPAGQETTPEIIGIRHHSPGCARLVAERIRTVRPAYVLIEGPMDVNGRIEEFLLDHQPPIAIYSYLSGQGGSGKALRHGSYAPFTDCSPEWQALAVGSEVGAQVRFIDLPAWHSAMLDVVDRYAEAITAPDPERIDHAERYQSGLHARLGVDNLDAAWDQLFEDTEHLTADELASRLSTHFAQLRDGDHGSTANLARETTMAHWINWAMARDDGPVLVVCGGYHAPALARLWPTAPTTLPQTPEPARDATGDESDGAIRYGSYLVPYSDKQLDAFAGYAAGMPSPGYQQRVWRHGLRAAGLGLARDVVERLRQRKQPASTAHVVAIHTRAQALARLRGHHETLRTDWLDAIAGALVEDALQQPLPWSYRGALRAGTDPVLVETVAVLAGERVGSLDPRTPRPPLLTSLHLELTALGLSLAHGRLETDLFDVDGVARSQLLHRLVLLQIPGVQRESGPESALGGGRTEVWRLHRPRAQEAALIEAAAYGATTHDAATARIVETISADHVNAATIAETLNAAAFAGLSDVQDRVLPTLRAAIRAEPRFDVLGAALTMLHPLRRHGDWLPIAGSPLLAATISAAVDRALWLFEPAAAVPPALLKVHLQSVQILRDIAQDALLDPDDLPDVNADRLLGVLRRKAIDDASPATSRGAALGALIALAPLLPAAEPTEPETVTAAIALLAGLPGEQAGDALAGLLAVGREALTSTPAFVTGVDHVVRSTSGEEFVRGLPAWRDAFAWLPSAERGRVADDVVALHGAHSRRTVTARLAGDPLHLAAAAAAERAALADLIAWGVVAEDAIGRAPESPDGSP